MTTVLGKKDDVTTCKMSRSNLNGLISQKYHVENCV